MVSTITFLAVAASVVSASTPPGFVPAVRTQLVVDYNNTLINGQVVAKDLVTTQPQIGIQQRRTGSSFTVIMVDLDIPTNVTGQTSTLLHWMQMGLSASTQASRIGRVGNARDTSSLSTDFSSVGSAGSAGAGDSTDAVQIAFLLRNVSTQAPAAPYISPNPPARLPLSHTYAQFLVDTTGLTAQSTAMQVLLAAAQTRQGFNVQQVLQQAGLSNKIVAANFFNVTNPGPVQTGNGNGNQQQGSGSTSTAGSTNKNSNGNSGSDSTSGSSSSSTSSGTSTTTDDNSGSGTLSGASSSTTAASGNVVKASMGSLTSVSGAVVVLAGIVATFSAL
ncbi:hypothetical protein SBRCBS47491_001017 [Sporothrix bragantina]|uniref:Uncharacterized protein n=1 Tax=Sporothrix bragantina TaxID=671064 RepID=A0ABP0AV29_9PEZI